MDGKIPFHLTSHQMQQLSGWLPIPSRVTLRT
jgi:hypothetical protein